MNLSALLTSAGINIGLCTLYLSLYSILRKQPSFLYVYFGRQLTQRNNNYLDAFNLERFVPSPSWIMKAWGLTEEEILSVGGLDAVVFLRIFVFSLRIFSIAAFVCVFGVLPINYFGQEMQHTRISAESLEVFTIANVKEGSRWLWVHCAALYVITCSACSLLYFEYKSISKMKLDYIIGSPPKPSHFTVLVRGIPKSIGEPLGDTIRNFFLHYHGSSYLGHQIICRRGKLQNFFSNVKMVYKKIFCFEVTALDNTCRSGLCRCGLCGGVSNSFRFYPDNFYERRTDLHCIDISSHQKECSSAFVFFKTRYAAIVASKVLQTSNPMLWVTDLAPEPNDVYWRNLWIPYRQLWVRRIATLLASIVFMFLFLIPVTFVQGLTQLEQMRHMLSFLKGIPNKAFVIQFVSGYLPSVILQLFLYTVPPTMMLFSTLEGPVSRSVRKKSALCKVLYFTIWNIFFVNVLSGSLITQLSLITRPKDIPAHLAKDVPRQATFFMTYVLALGWTSLSSEVLQSYSLLYHLTRKYIFRCKDDPSLVPSFPYHTEVPKVLLFGLLGFTCSILAPLILPFLLVYFFLGYLVYRNQILNVYSTSYDSGGRMWPIVHNTTVFSLVLTQIIALGVFGIKASQMASAFTIPLLIITLLFSEYCKKHFYPIFRDLSAQDFIDMDRDDEQCGRMPKIHEQLFTAYAWLAPPPPPPITGALELCYVDGEPDSPVQVTI
ncbi:CSC1-like protein RXW8 [Zingiber officinale]|uniref:CSC1-like protein RXW8 n=1 Tax=Zingiber officinale TaxID=94328 RepID=A0A8J5HSH9_ZINOF|nr:CSC1-like protein RXW8 [Zingiber officinale]XP_042378808.1 CSC1-like protein RXW8 [Zingiber officinale]KAG6532793.1 hypothetical protein ZIOFF_006646 [Zingiber officinale]